MDNVVQKEIKKNPKTSVMTLALLVTIAIAFLAALRQNNWVVMITALVIALLLLLPRIVGKLSHITIPIKMEVYTILFIYCTLFLGEMKNYYVKYWWWDVLIHTSSGLAFGLMGFLILYILYRAEKIKTSPKVVALFSFCFALAMGALWEIFEFAIDNTLGPISNGTNMQTVVNGCGLVDTMKDLIADSIGALFSGIMSYLYLKRESGVVVKPMAKEFKKNNPRLFGNKSKKK